MKVLFFSTSGEDLFRYRLPVARCLADAGYDIVFVGPEEDAVSGIRGAGFDYRGIGRTRNRFAPLSDLWRGFRLGKVYREVNPDIAHHFGLSGIVQGAVAARRANVSWVVHSVPSLYDGDANSAFLRSGLIGIIRWALRKAEVTFRTAEDRQILIAKGCVRPEQTHIIKTSGIDLKAFPAREEHGQRPVIAMIGSLEDSRTVEDFVEGARTAHEHGTTARFVLLGHGTGSAAAERIRRSLETSQERGIVEWWGFRENLSGSLGNVHAVYVPDCVGDEAERTLLGAAATGRPIVTADLPGCRRLVRDRENGILVPHGDVTSLTTAFEELIDDAAGRQELGRNARQLVETEFSADLVARETMAVYERLFERGRVI